MEALIAIAALCQIASGAAYSLKQVDAHQLTCQKYYTICYDKKGGGVGKEERAWIGPLKDCINERTACSTGCP